MSLPVLAAALLTAAAPASAPAATPAAKPGVITPTLHEPAISPKLESACGIVTKADPKAKPEFHQVEGLRVLGGPVKLSLPASKVPIDAVYCKRDTIVPGAGDGRILWELRKALVLQDASREGALEITPKGAYSFRMTLGTVSDAERQAIVDRLRIFQANLRLIAQAEANARAQAAARSGSSAPQGAATAAPPPKK